MIDKNILYFTRTMGLGGTEKVILQLCRSFNGEFNKIIVCSSGGIHEEELKRLGIKHYIIKDIENKNPINIFKTFIILMKIIKIEKIDIVHTHHRMAAFYISIIKNIMNFKFIHTSHNTFNDKKFLTNIFLSDANIIAVGNKVKENLCDFYKIDSDKIEVIYNGIEKNNSSIKEIHEVKEFKDKGYFLIANIGRLSQQKGMEYYIKAIPNVIKNNEKIIFFIVGEGEERIKLQNLAISLKVNNNVIFLGYRDDIINVIKQFDLIVLSSLWEGLPLTPIEAFSVGKTVIGTRVDGTTEIIKDNYNGILINPTSIEEIEKSVLKLYNNRELKEKLEKNAYKTYEREFSYEKFISKYKIYYKNR